MNTWKCYACVFFDRFVMNECTSLQRQIRAMELSLSYVFIMI